MTSMIEGRLGIDTDERWGFSHTNQWIFGYKLHIASSVSVFRYQILLWEMKVVKSIVKSEVVLFCKILEIRLIN